MDNNQEQGSSAGQVSSMNPLQLMKSEPAYGGGGRAHEQAGEQQGNGMSDNDDGSDMDERGGGIDGAKRPRLRLAHACDRCRKRKIRCDTQQPCGPCQATKNECTFHTPSRRVNKPKDSEPRSSSLSGVKRPHSPVKGSSRIGALGPEGQANLEARLAALEAMLGDVPPKVHNAFLSSLDARLGSGGGVGINEGSGEGVGVALEALAGAGFGNRLGGNFGMDSSSWGNGLGARASLGQSPGLPGWTRRSTTGDDGINDMAKKMENMSFFYEDEIGQAKWQGEYQINPSCATGVDFDRRDIRVSLVGSTDCFKYTTRRTGSTGRNAHVVREPQYIPRALFIYSALRTGAKQ